MQTEVNTNLIRAVKRGRLAEVERLIASGADVNCADVQGWTPLFLAAGTGNVKMMRLLVASGARVDGTGENDLFPLFAAVLSRHIEAVRLLLSAGARADVVVAYSPLVNLVPHDWKHRAEAVALLLAAHRGSERLSNAAVQRTGGSRRSAPSR